MWTVRVLIKCCTLKVLALTRGKVKNAEFFSPCYEGVLVSVHTKWLGFSNAKQVKVMVVFYWKRLKPIMCNCNRVVFVDKRMRCSFDLSTYTNMKYFLHVLLLGNAFSCCYAEYSLSVLQVRWIPIEYLMLWISGPSRKNHSAKLVSTNTTDLNDYSKHERIQAKLSCNICVLWLVLSPRVLVCS